MPAPAPATLFAFDRANEAEWDVVNDGVMGGHSAGFELRVRGSGRQFDVEIDDGTRTYGRTISRRAPIATTADWTTVRVPFSALRSTIFGRAVNAAPLDVAHIRGVGLYVADGKDGTFRLEVDYIRSYSEGA